MDTIQRFCYNLLMITKPRRVNKKYYEKQADKMIQELGRKTYDRCLVCGGSYCCLHHFVFKSQSTALRYDMENLIPICNPCHFSVHNRKDDKVAAKIGIIKGQDWLNSLEDKIRQGRGQKYGAGWYKEKYEYLKDILGETRQKLGIAL